MSMTGGSELRGVPDPPEATPPVIPRPPVRDTAPVRDTLPASDVPEEFEPVLVVATLTVVTADEPKPDSMVNAELEPVGIG
jgi:hypothetical protein